jgi:hypothetical protein
VIAALLDPALEPIVDMVVTRDGSAYEARALDGAVRFRRDADDAGRHDYSEVHVEERNPLADTATDRFPTLAAERATPCPTRTQQSYPRAHDQIAQLFDHPAAPDLVCLRTAAFFVVADYGMEDSNPAVTGDWSIALDACGVPYRDEAYGFIYVDP